MPLRKWPAEDRIWFEHFGVRSLRELVGPARLGIEVSSRRKFHKAFIQTEGIGTLREEGSRPQ